jgi:hypothetical protein
MRRRGRRRKMRCLEDGMGDRELVLREEQREEREGYGK